MNGNRILKTDDNDEKDIVLRGQVHGGDGIQLGVSYFRGISEDAAGETALDESATGLDLMWELRFTNEPSGFRPNTF